MRILHVFDHSIPLHSGYAFRSLAIIREQRARGWETEHLTSSKHRVAKVEQEQVEGLRFFRTLPVQEGLQGLLGRLPVLDQAAVVNALERRLEQVAREVRPDILHAHSPALNGLATVRVGRRLGIPVVYEVRAFWEDAAVSHGTGAEGGLRYRLTRALETRVLRRAQAVTCICEGLRGDIIARGIAPERVTVIPNAVDHERFTHTSERDTALAAELGLDGKRVVGFLGSFYQYEGLDLLLFALPRMLQEMPDIHLLLVGGGPMEQVLRTQTRDLGLEDKVLFTGRVPHDQVDRYYSLVDVLAYPRHSMRVTELVTPLKPLEAMAQGHLMVASDVGGHRELIRDGETGVLFRADDPADLAAKTVDLLRHGERWQAMREAGRHFVDSERNWRASVARYAPVYQRLAGA